MTRTHPLQSHADRLAERHARALTNEQKPQIDPEVRRLAAEGYNAKQVSMLLRMPAIDVRLQFAMMGRL